MAHQAASRKIVWVVSNRSIAKKDWLFRGASKKIICARLAWQKSIQPFVEPRPISPSYYLKLLTYYLDLAPDEPLKPVPVSALKWRNFGNNSKWTAPGSDKLEIGTKIMEERQYAPNKCLECGATIANCCCEDPRTVVLDSSILKISLTELENIDCHQILKKDTDIGDTLGDRYHLLSVLGSGGMGKVFKARHVTLPKFFAVKILKCELSKNMDLRARFDQEAKTASLLNHPHLVSIYDYGATAQDEAYLVMDYLDGESLADSLRLLKRIDQRQAVKIFTQICEGLAHAHALGVIHRDLKPGNIMLVRSNECSNFVKIVDFGIAKMLGVDGGVANITQGLTRTGEFFGSPLYISPEQASGGKADQRTDIYAMGVLMYECLSSSPPFKGENFFAILSQHMEVMPQPFNSSLDIDENLEAIVRKALEKDPHKRFQSIEELKLALADVFAEDSIPLLAIPEHGKKRSLLFLSIGAILLLLFGTAISAFLLESKIMPSLLPYVSPAVVSLPKSAITFTAPAKQVALPPIPEEIRLGKNDERRSAEELVAIGQSLINKIGESKENSLLPARYFTSAIEKNPKLMEAYESLSAFYWQRQGKTGPASRIENLEKCLTVYNEQLTQKPDDFQAYCNRCSTNLELDKFSQALVDADSGLKIQPTNAALHLKHAYANYKLHHLKVALAEYKQFLPPTDFAGYYTMGCCYQDLHQFQEAINLCSKAMENGGPHDGLLMVRADSERALGRYKEALRDYQRMVTLFPNTLNARSGAIAECRNAIASKVN